jgi:hypothetical protein
LGIESARPADLPRRAFVTSELRVILAVEGDAAEAAEDSADSRVRANVKVTRGHDRAKTLQIRLNDTELEELNSLAAQRGLPVSTVARQLLLQSLVKENELAAAFDRLELALAQVRRLALQTKRGRDPEWAERRP